jgi:hypothetical protein
MNDFLKFFCVIAVCITLLGASELILLSEKTKVPICQFTLGVNADINAERFGFTGSMSNIKITNVSITAPCDSRGFVNMSSLGWAR